jgi:peptidyl-prolyl cis-trans isomerase SurA
MVRLLLSAVFFGGLLGPTAHRGGAAAMASSQELLLDRIVAHVEDDILFASELAELGQFQRFTGSQKENDAKLLDRLIDQWIVNTEATAAHFPLPSDAEVEHEIAAMKKSLESPGAFESRIQNAGLTVAQLHRLVRQQLYLTRYLDYKFRAAAQIPQSDIEKYYRETLAPQLAARGQATPPLQTVEDEIRKVLVEREITLRADRWLEETRAHLRIDRNLTPK